MVKRYVVLGWLAAAMIVVVLGGCQSSSTDQRAHDEVQWKQTDKGLR